MYDCWCIREACTAVCLLLDEVPAQILTVCFIPFVVSAASARFVSVLKLHRLLELVIEHDGGTPLFLVFFLLARSTAAVSFKVLRKGSCVGYVCRFHFMSPPSSRIASVPVVQHKQLTI